MKLPEIDCHPSYVCSYSSTNTACRSQLMIHIVYFLASNWVLKEVFLCEMSEMGESSHPWHMAHGVKITYK